MNTLHFFKTNGEIVLNICSSVGIMCQLHVIMKAVFFFWNAQAQVPFHSLLFPELVPLFLCTGANEKLHLHLLKLAHPENKLTGYDLIAECFSNLCNTERNFHPASFL